MGTAKKLVGLLGGTFNPVHNGHIAIAEHCLSTYGLDEIQFMPNNIQPSSKHVGVDANIRADMLSLALAGFPYFSINTVELEQNKSSFTVDSLQLLRAQNPDIIWCFIIGFDTFNQLNTWNGWQDLFSLCHIIVVDRRGSKIHYSAWQKEALSCYSLESNKSLRNYDHGKLILDDVYCDDGVSSSAVRAQLLGSNDASGIPPSVLAYIKQHKLYL